MALFRTLSRTPSLLTYGEVFLTASRGLTAKQQRAGRRSLAFDPLGGPWCPGGSDPARFPSSPRWVDCFRSAIRCSSSAQTSIRSSIQDPADPLLRAKKHVMTLDELTTVLANQSEAGGGARGVRLVDLREPKEIEDTGILPGAINIPLSRLKASLALEPAQFEAEIGAPKPTKDDPAPLVFYALCGGVKSSAALEIAHKLGFKKARHFPGGWEEWSSKQVKV